MKIASKQEEFVAFSASTSASDVLTGDCEETVSALCICAAAQHFVKRFIRSSLCSVPSCYGDLKKVKVSKEDDCSITEFHT